MATISADDSKVLEGGSLENLLVRLEASSRDELPPELAKDVAATFAKLLRNEVVKSEARNLLVTLYRTNLESHPDILARASDQMKLAALRPNTAELIQELKRKGIKIGSYRGGLCDIVGTGGDGWKTFNISTASSIIASAILLIAKHGNRASTSTSGSADVLARMEMKEGKPQLSAVSPENLALVYEHTNYGFLYAPNFHVGLQHVAPLRKEIPHPSIFNLLGPLANPAADAVEAQVIGVKNRELVPTFAEALRIKGVTKAMVVCGYENLDEISCANPTQCARLIERPSRDAIANSDATNGHATNGHNNGRKPVVEIEHFSLAPQDYGLPEHTLQEVSPGKTPEENSAILHRLLTNTMLPHELPILDFVLMNVAALFVIAGVCDTDQSAFGDNGQVIKEVGPGGGRWKEGVRLARLAIESGKAYDELRKFTQFSNKVVLG